MKNLFFVAVPFVALLAGCPIGPIGNEGEGEGEGEGDPPFAATLDMTFPNPVSDVVVNGETDPCLDLTAHTFEVVEADGYNVKPTPTDTNRRCVMQTVDVEEPGSYQMDWADKCGPFANGTYDAGDGFLVEVTTDDTGERLLLRASALLPGFFDLVVNDDGTIFGEGDDIDGVHHVAAGTETADLCTIIFHQEGDDGSERNFVLSSLDASCAG
ncbi:hypothetical protein A2856_00170 [Candidatus Uhrbacteria bacterium RIFCSPHIGHO2_01_FULL_63_20]|uniref:Uncharacterized protein n=1 Tax=Candidatus Uhrbacteria bacterium RIFCSPHIGHO2_01_FULL_63_20 TaxID=1802385 RepID=A0A1F7TMR7_9BACT|nr:MAG: hypothetical protein A2856_00170 [Candidatus Uhrbacteria bacterium RIFCSPHIGHO2_01_FULL_63_20]